ncbi:MAG: hypothetical protein D6740_03180 [Alphaproteobacteria bacterium]|nr:MAG: hypothetical protein D6740_03180 [Alphaproteobacteria bacterium]
MRSSHPKAGRLLPPATAGLIAAGMLLRAGATPLAQTSPNQSGESPAAGPPSSGETAPGEAAPRCDAAHEGIVACFANVLCLCRFHPGDAARKLPDRFAWDCGITRPQCHLPPADLTPVDPYAVPPVIVDVDHPHADDEDNQEAESVPPQP